ncbi:unnamed protein product [Lathyrus oleraceus]|uniref:RING-type domain-containing protein n=2 Tax=Pisum sativum TaxID=3888 RepID=A0A9D4W8T7_PEA|nr:uncharacterized RING finger protein C548.05c-like isoform X2 [Pisum sativum]KAI5397172.1 hypothetical protein KIW84_063119 [Pisum sativum]
MNNRRRNTNLLDLDNIHEESSLGEGPSESIHIPINYLEEIDDDVVECSPRSFAQVAANAGSNRRRIAIDFNSENPTLPSENIENQTVPTSVMHSTANITEPIGQNTINLEVSINEAAKNDKKSLETNKEVFEPKIQAVETPKELALNCPLCRNPFVEEMSTMCGHIFCKSCIKNTISRHRKCPTCRKRLTSRGLRRVFLPSSN